MKEWIDSHEFYELMQFYRWADAGHDRPEDTVAAFEAVKTAILAQVEALQADAERYRFAIHHPDFAICKWTNVRSYDGTMEKGWDVVTENVLDAARKDQP